MHIIDPETATTTETAADPAEAATGAVADPAEGMLAAITDAEPEAVEPAANTKPDPTQESSAKPDGEVADPAKPEPDKEAEAEIASLGLKEKAAERFRTMASEIKELAPIREQLEKAGITDISQLPQIVSAAKDGQDLVKMVSETGASPEQFGQTLDYLALVSAASKGDLAAAEKAFEVIGAEYAALAKALNREVPGVHDPLEAHADLRDAIEAGDMTRKHALEVAQARTLASAQQQAARQTREQTAQQQRQQQAKAKGVAALKAWEAPKLADPAYAAIRPALNAEVAKIRQQFPPAQWTTATEYAYQALAARMTKPAPKVPTPGPVRPTGPRPAMMPTTEDPLEAMMQGIAAASA